MRLRYLGFALLSTFAATAASAFEAVLSDPLDALFDDSKTADVKSFSEIDVPFGGVVDADVLLNGLDPAKPLSVKASAAAGEWFRLVDVPVKSNTGIQGFTETAETKEFNRDVIRKAPFRIFEAMEPVPSRLIANPKATTALRFRLAKLPIRPGRFEIALTMSQGSETKELRFSATVHDVQLPPTGASRFKYTNWFDFGGMASRHGLVPWSESHWAMIAEYVKLAVSGRQNMAWITRDVVFSNPDNGFPVLNEERLVRLVRLYLASGIRYVEGPHLANFVGGKWGAPYFVASNKAQTTAPEGRACLAAMADQLYAAIVKYGWKDIWYQHVADEPGDANAAEYRITCGIVRRHMPGIRLTDAVEIPALAGALDVHCPKVHTYQHNRAKFDAFRAAGDELWCYTCCVPGGKWMNRTIDQELLRPALIPWGATLYGIDGFLHWGYNMYQRGQDPFVDSSPREWAGTNGGRTVPAGDTHIVYPGKDGPWSSKRFEATRLGMEDAELLNLLSRRGRDTVEKTVRKLVRGFDDYEKDARKYRAVRRELLEAVAGWRDLFSPGFPEANFDPKIWTVDSDGCLTASKDVAFWTKADWGDFEVECEYNLDPGANSGILLYCSDITNWVPNAVEVQLLDNDARKWKGLNPIQSNLAFFGHQPPSSMPSKPAGQWNRVTLLADGSHLRLSLNGVVVNECDLSVWTDAKKLPDGTDIPRWLSRPWSDLPHSGKLGFQGRHDGAGVRFRNFRIRKLVK